MIGNKRNKVSAFTPVVPKPKVTPPPTDDAHRVDHDRSQYVEPTKTRRTTYNRLRTYIGGICICIMFAVAFTVPLMIALYGKINKEEPTTIVATTDTILTTTISWTSTTNSSTTSSISTTITPITTTNTVAVPLYGVQINFDPTLLPSGWSQCYNGTYDIFMTPSLLASILSTCNQGKLMLGCRPVGNNSLTVAAMGLRADVLYNCSTISNCSNVANGVGWYYSDSYSWGFVNNTDLVDRNSCDTGSINPSYRLCWHGSISYGGYRCGSILGLNSATSYERVIYHAN